MVNKDEYIFGNKHYQSFHCTEHLAAVVWRCGAEQAYIPDLTDLARRSRVTCAMHSRLRLNTNDANLTLSPGSRPPSADLSSFQLAADAHKASNLITARRRRLIDEQRVTPIERD